MQFFKRVLHILLCTGMLVMLSACTAQQEETPAPVTETTGMIPVPVSSQAEPVQEHPALPEPLAPQGAPSITLSKTYSITIPGEPEQTLVLDEQGNVMQGAHIPVPLKDILTGKIRYYTYTQTAGEAKGGAPVTWLYAADGTALEGTDCCSYGAAMGGFVLKQLLPGDGTDAAEPDRGACWLYDPAARTAKENVWSAEKLTVKTALLIDADRHMLGVFDAGGQLLYEDPYGGAFSFGYSCGGFILGYPDEGGCAVLNEKLEILETTPKMFDLDLYDCGDQGVYCVKKDDTQRLIYRAVDWKLEGTFAEDYQYTDGVNVVCGDDHSKNLKLHSMRGKRLAGPFDKISPEKDAGDRPTGRFLARKNNTVYLLNKHGETVKQRKVSGLVRAYSTFDGLCLCEYTFENDWTGRKETGYRLYTADLKYMTDTERNYLSVEKAAEGIYAVRRQNGETSFRTDLIDASGEVIFKKPEAVGTGDDAALAVFREGTVGLIDAEGNWIAKTVLFGEEDEEE